MQPEPGWHVGLGIPKGDEMRNLVLLVMTSSACTMLAPAFPAEDVKVNGKLHTLAFHTGGLDATRDLYDPSFDVAAEKACGNKNYRIVEKSYSPSTLLDTPGLKAAGRFFWVVECGAE